MRYLAVALVLCGLVLLAGTSAGAVPPPPPKFWTVSRCERVLLGIYGGGGLALPNAP
jgi:hypothetical protein